MCVKLFDIIFELALNLSAGPPKMGIYENKYFSSIRIICSTVFSFECRGRPSL